MQEESASSSETGRDLLPTRLPASVGAPIRTFVIADIREYTRFTQVRGDDAAAQLTRIFAGLARGVAGEAGGRMADCRGDEVLLVFESPRAALRAAVNLQEECRRQTESDPDFPLEIGVGIDAGEALPVEEGFRGGALNLASRLCGMAGPGTVLTSDGVMHLARRVEGLEIADRGLLIVKGIDEPLRVYQVARQGQLGEIPTMLRAARVQKTKQNREPVRVLGIVGGSFGIAAVLIELIFGVVPSGRPLLPILAIAGCLLSFIGADRALHHPMAATVLLIGAAVLLALALSWLSALAVVLLLIGAGMSYFQRQVY